jgi:glutathione reductase (NADPH)
MFDYDLLVIGAGSGGVRVSRIAASLGAKVAVAEDTHMGGTCVNVGCVPKKLFVYASDMRKSLVDMAGYGLHVSDRGFDWPTLRDNKTDEIKRLNGIYDSMLDGAGVTVFKGNARMTGSHEVTIGEQVYTAKFIVIASGGTPFVPDIPGKEHLITSDDAFYLPVFPKRVLVVGGGYIAVEFAGIFNGLGAQTQLLYRGPQILRGFDQEVRDFTATQIQQSGVNIHTNADLLSVSALPDGRLEATIQSGDHTTIELFDSILMATGRTPRVAGLGLESIGVALSDKKAVVVNDYFQTSVEHIFAIGDVIDRVPLTPVALSEGMWLANHLFGESPKQGMDYSDIPTAVFSQPPVGTLGMTEAEAEATGKPVKVFTSQFRPMKHILAGNPGKTLMKMLVCGESDRILGIHIVGADAGEMLQGFAVAVKAGATKADFDRTIGIHPTAAEELVTMRSVTRTLNPA